MMVRSKFCATRLDAGAGKGVAFATAEAGIWPLATGPAAAAPGGMAVNVETGL
jgi:hypothetical protein